MPGLDPTSLRPEEKFGGFPPNDPESFYLEQLPSYPSFESVSEPNNDDNQQLVDNAVPDTIEPEEVNFPEVANIDAPASQDDIDALFAGIQSDEPNTAQNEEIIENDETFEQNSESAGKETALPETFSTENSQNEEETPLDENTQFERLDVDIEQFKSVDDLFRAAESFASGGSFTANKSNDKPTPKTQPNAELVQEPKSIDLPDVDINDSENSTPDQARQFVSPSSPVEPTVESIAPSQPSDNEIDNLGISFDPSLLALIQNDLAEGARRRNNRERERSDEQAVYDVDDIPGSRDLGQMQNQTYFDLTNIQAEHPSSYSEYQPQQNIDQDFNINADNSGGMSYAEFAQSVSEEPQIPFDELNPAQEASEIQPEEKKKRIIAIPKWVQYSAAGVAILSLLGSGTYYFIVPKFLGNHGSDSTLASVGNTHNAQGSTHQNHSSEHKSTEPNSNTSHATSHENEKTQTHGTEQTNHESTHDASHEKANHNSAPEKTSHDESSQHVEKTTSSQKHEHEGTEKETAASHEKNAKTKIQHSSAASHHDVDEKEHTKKSNRKSTNKPTPFRDVVGVYAVQVYSSPLREDAEDWENRLRRKQAVYPNITTQNVRGQTWYRVRFGNFSTQKEAERAALSMGFPNSWIVRLK